MTMHITAHPFSLGVEQCSCCKLPKPGIEMKRAGRKVCQACTPHVAPKASHLQLNKEHLDAWVKHDKALREEAKAREDRDASQITSLTRRAQRLEVELTADGQNRPTQEVERLLQSEEVQQARAERDSAFASRSAAFRVLWRLDQKHNIESPSAACSCGRQGCDVAAQLRPITDALWKWEKRETERARQGLQDGLPDEHPEARKSRRTHRTSNN